MCQFITFYAWRCLFNVVSVHGWLTWADVRDISMLPFASHMWEVGSKAMCAYLRVFTCMQCLMLHLIFTCVSSLLVHVGRQTLQMKTVDRLQALYQHRCLPCLKLLCILKVLWPWPCAVCSVTFTDRIQAQMAVLETKLTCNYTTSKHRECKSVIFENAWFIQYSV